MGTPPKETGGPAFPATETEPHTLQPGMTLRDWFAGQAIPTICSNPSTAFEDDAEAAYLLADEMLKARDQ